MMKSKNKSEPLSSKKNQTRENVSTEISSNDQQFELELCWCIQQLRSALSTGKLKQREIKDHTKALNTLISKTAPIIQKRQTMRLSFGDYRKKMTDQEKQFHKISSQVKVSTAVPNTKSKFVKKSTGVSSNNFKFNFDVPKENEEVLHKCHETNKQFCFLPSDNNFRFNFEIVS